MIENSIRKYARYWVFFTFLVLAVYVGVLAVASPDPTPYPSKWNLHAVDSDVVGFREINDGVNIQREWDIVKTVKPQTGLIEADVKSVALIALNIPVPIAAQITVWRDECANALADPGYVNDPDNQIIKNDDVGAAGLTELEWCQAQVDVFSILLAANGNTLNTNNITNEAQCPNCVTVLGVIRDSYFSANPYTYDVAGNLVSREDMELSLTQIRQLIGAEALVSLRSPYEISYTITERECINGCTQFAVPTGGSDVGYTDATGGDNDGAMWDEVDEGIDGGTPDDGTTYFEHTAGNPSQTTPGDCGSQDFVNLNLFQPLTDPGVNTGFVQKWRGQKDASGGRQIDFYYTICESAVEITNCTDADMAATWTTHTCNVPEAEAANVTVFNNMRWDVACHTVGGGPGRNCQITAVEMQMPDASSRRRMIIIS